MGDPVQERRRHFAVPKDLWPFAESQISGYDQRGPLIELRDQVEQQLATVF